MCYFFLVVSLRYWYNNNQEEGNNANRKNKEKAMKTRHSHFTNFGISTPPGFADAEGYIAYRDGYENLPKTEWTLGEIWIAKNSLRVSVQNGSVDENDAIDRQIELQEAESLIWDKMQQDAEESYDRNNR